MVITLLFSLLGGGFLGMLLYLRILWEKDFSYRDFPDLTTPSLLGRPLSTKVNTAREKAIEYAKRTNTLGGNTNLTTEKASRLDFDHIYMDFGNYALLHYVVFCSASCTVAICGVINLKIREFLEQRNWIKKVPFYPEEVAAKIALGTTNVLHYVDRSDDNQNIAIFHWDKLALLKQNDRSIRIAKNFRVEIDLPTEKLVYAELDGSEVTAKQCIILLSWPGVVQGHPALHACANWAVNIEEEQRKAHPDLFWANLVTIGYNYFGKSSFLNESLFSKVFPDYLPNEEIVKILHHSEDSGIVEHSNVTDLVKHSYFVRFAVSLRKSFLAEFAKHKVHSFAGCNGEALFAGTVLHSLDHWRFEANLKDPLWLDVECPKFGSEAYLMRIARVAFSDDIPLPFNTKMKRAKHPFFKAVYAHALKIDKEWANELDTCICK